MAKRMATKDNSFILAVVNVVVVVITIVEFLLPYGGRLSNPFTDFIRNRIGTFSLLLLWVKVVIIHFVISFWHNMFLGLG